MDMLSRLAGAQGQRGDQLNIELAEELTRTENLPGIKQLAAGLTGDPSTASDCIKVLYEIGARNPSLIAPYAETFVRLLQSKNNRLVWGAMMALRHCVSCNPDPVDRHLDLVLAAYETGSVITVDNAVSVLAELCAADKAHEERVMPLLYRHLRRCRAREIPQHLERMAVCLNAGTLQPVADIVAQRLEELSPTQRKRVQKVLRKIQT